MILIFKQLEKYQTENYSENLNLKSFFSHTSLELLMFLNSQFLLKITNFWRKSLALFHDIKKKEIYFPYNTFASYVCWEREFFWRIYKDGINI